MSGLCPGMTRGSTRGDKGSRVREPSERERAPRAIHGKGA